MPDELLFCILKEFNKPRSMAGKVWRVKVLSGDLRVGDPIRLYCVNSPNRKSTFSKVDAVVKHVKREFDSGLPGAEELNYHAVAGDIVTINVSQCYIDDKKIDKNKIKVNRISIGASRGSAFTAHNRIKIRFPNSPEFIDKVEKSNSHASLLLWFGKGVAVSAEGVDAEAGVVTFGLMNGKELPVPENPELRALMQRVIIKYRCYVGKFANNKNEYRWRYAVGEFLR